MKPRHLFDKSLRNTTQLVANRSYYDVETVIRNRLQSGPQFVRRLELDHMLEGHDGCVNCLEWNATGSLLASASDDSHVMIWDAFRHRRLIDWPTQHRFNIFSVKFLPNRADQVFATGAGDGKVMVHDLNRSQAPIFMCRCHRNRVKRLATAPDSPYVFWSSGEDGIVLQFDLREPHHCRADDRVLLINMTNYVGKLAEIKCISINQRRPEQLAVGANDPYARLFDRRMITLGQVAYQNADDAFIHLQYFIAPTATDTIPPGCVQYYCPGHFNQQPTSAPPCSVTNKTITYLTFSPDGNELLVNIGCEQIYLFDLNAAKRPEALQMPQMIKRNKAEPRQPESGAASAAAAAAQHCRAADELKLSGNKALEKGKYLQAIAKYSAAIRLAPDYAALYLNRATAYMRRNWHGDVYEALRDCQRAIHLDDDYVKAHFRLARALLQLERATEANEYMEALFVRFPEHSRQNDVLMLHKEIHATVTNQRQASSSPAAAADDDDGDDDENAGNYTMGDQVCSADELHYRGLAKDYRDRFVGHCNQTTDIKEASFFGNDGNFIIAGSDDGNFFVWERPTNMIAAVYEGDGSIVNCVQPHPFACLLATSGIDAEIRLWTPKPEEDFVAVHKRESFVRPVQDNQQKMQMTGCQTS